jgi:hypothetical protein
MCKYFKLLRLSDKLFLEHFGHFQLSLFALLLVVDQSFGQRCRNILLNPIKVVLKLVDYKFKIACVYPDAGLFSEFCRRRLFVWIA